MVSWLPLHHDMGLIYGALVPLINSGTTTLMLPASFIADPLRWVTGMETYHANYTASPDFGYGLVGKTLMRSPDFRADLSSLKFAIDGSEPISPLTIGGFRKLSTERLNLDPRALTPCYGLAEASLAVCAAPGLGPRRGSQPITAFSAAQLGRGRATPATADEEATHLVSVGTYTLRTGVTIVAPETHRALPDGVIGEIWLSGPGIPPGYWRHEDATEETFRAHLVGDPNTEHLRTGDLGVLHEGHLYITGRAKDLIIHRGVNIYPQDVEQTLRSLPEVPTRRVCIAQRPVNGVERTVVIVEATTGASPNDTAVAAIVPACRQAILDVHGLPVDDVVVVAPHAILWTTSGKVRRSATVDAYLRGELPILFESRGQARGGSRYQHSRSRTDLRSGCGARRRTDRGRSPRHVSRALRHTESAGMEQVALPEALCPRGRCGACRPDATVPNNPHPAGLSFRPQPRCTTRRCRLPLLHGVPHPRPRPRAPVHGVERAVTPPSHAAGGV